MAKSKYEYVKAFEQQANLLPNTFLVVRIDGRGFHHLSSRYNFEKPNDQRALDLMNAAAIGVLKELPDIAIAYGISDEYRSIIGNRTTLSIIGLFAFSALSSIALVVYSIDEKGHINNLYNTAFWALVQKGDLRTTEAEQLLKGTVASQKNEILFSRFGINYNAESEQFKKGSVLYKNYGTQSIVATNKPTANPQEGEDREVAKARRVNEKKRRSKAEITLQYVDIIRDDFWNAHPWLLSDE
ncbi:MAG: hypothetical protein Q9178_004657 [Gyalolechia marmorata]